MANADCRCLVQYFSHDIARTKIVINICAHFAHRSKPSLDFIETPYNMKRFKLDYLGVHVFSLDTRISLESQSNSGSKYKQ